MLRTQTFRKYITYKKDHNELLLHLLMQLLRDEVQLIQTKRGSDIESGTVVRISLDEFETRAAELDIHDLHPFYGSSQFRGNHFELDSNDRVIIKTL
jgi:DNA replication licensing factor MCM2